MPKGSIFISVVVIGVREGQSICDVTKRSREKDEEEKVSPPVVRKVVQLVSHVQME